MRILVVDNYDSFVFNLVQYLGQLGVEAQVWRNDDARLSDHAAIATEVDGILLSPGPGTPERAGASRIALRAPRAERSEHQKVAERSALHLGQSVGRGAEEPRRPSAQPIQIRRQRRRRRG